jgi:polyvinyl alcohol dehydrogenase (cytochrome)
VTTAEREANCAGFRVGPSFDTVNGVPGHGGSIKVPGPTIVDGMLFIGSGYAGLVPGNVLLAFGVD